MVGKGIKASIFPRLLAQCILARLKVLVRAGKETDRPAHPEGAALLLFRSCKILELVYFLATVFNAHQPDLPIKSWLCALRKITNYYKISTV